jgi:ubiquinone/menaquinone biosynthesis C-methylase UbiE
MSIAWWLILAAGFGVLFNLGWRWASRKWSLPCPTLVGRLFEYRIYQRLSGVQTTLDRMGLRPGQRILEIGPGPGRLLIPAAERILPHGEAVGIDIQPGMIERLKVRTTAAQLSNLTAILGDATEQHVPDGSFDLVFLCTTLGEIPDRAAALSRCFLALKPGGVLSITEMFGDPHYQSLSTVKRLAQETGFQSPSVQGRWWFYTANFKKP